MWHDDAGGAPGGNLGLVKMSGAWDSPTGMVAAAYRISNRRSQKPGRGGQPAIAIAAIQDTGINTDTPALHTRPPPLCAY